MCIGGGVKFLRLLGVCLALLLLAGAAAWFFRDTLVDALVQSRLGAELSRLVGADVELNDSTYRDGTLRVGRGVVSGPNLPFARLQFEGVRTAVEWRQLRDFGGSPLHIEAENIDLVWRDRGTQRTEGGSPAGASGKKVPPVDILAERFSFRHEDGADWSIRDTKARLRYDKGSWSFSANGGRLEIPGWPSLEIERLTGEQLRAEKRRRRPRRLGHLGRGRNVRGIQLAGLQDRRFPTAKSGRLLHGAQQRGRGFGSRRAPGTNEAGGRRNAESARSGQTREHIHRRKLLDGAVG
jgi:hypothetical protein